MANKRKQFTKIYDQYIGKIYRYIYLKVNSEEVAQDLSSETFLRCWEAFGQDKIENPRAFLYKIAGNLVIDHYRANGRTQLVSTDSLPIVDPKVNLEDSMANESELNQIKAKLANLRDDYQNVIIWHYLDDLSIREVAKLLDRSEDATRVLLHRALDSLKNNVNPPSFGDCNKPETFTS